MSNAGNASVTVPPGAWWDGRSQRWMIDGARGPVPLDPQPPPVTDGAGGGLVVGNPFSARAVLVTPSPCPAGAAVPPALRVDL